MLKYILVLRPSQWIKNLLILFPPLFGGTIFQPQVMNYVLSTLFVFSAAASCTYILNDIKDIKADKNHLVKRHRPIARGEIETREALVVALVLLLLSLASSFFVSVYLWIFISIYLVISISYTLYFKNVVIADIFFVSAGFIIRVLAGGHVFSVPVSDWLFLTVFLVSLFLASGKRLGELLELGVGASSHRKSLAAYSDTFIEGMLWFSASSSLVTYALYTIEQRNRLFYTVPLAAFGFLRYIYLVKNGKGDPTDILLSDRQIMSTGILWVFAIAIIRYM